MKLADIQVGVEYAFKAPHKRYTDNLRTGIVLSKEYRTWRAPGTLLRTSKGVPVAVRVSEAIFDDNRNVIARAVRWVPAIKPPQDIYMEVEAYQAAEKVKAQRSLEDARKRDEEREALTERLNAAEQGLKAIGLESGDDYYRRSYEIKITLNGIENLIELVGKLR